MLDYSEYQETIKKVADKHDKEHGPPKLKKWKKDQIDPERKQEFKKMIGLDTDTTDTDNEDPTGVEQEPRAEWEPIRSDQAEQSANNSANNSAAEDEEYLRRYIERTGRIGFRRELAQRDLGQPGEFDLTQFMTPGARAGESETDEGSSSSSGNSVASVTKVRPGTWVGSTEFFTPLEVTENETDDARSTGRRKRLTKRRSDGRRPAKEIDV